LEHLKGARLSQAPALPTNVGLGWKGLPWTNALAYYKRSLITEDKSFITFAQMDATVSTGASAMMAIRVLLDHDVPEEHIHLVAIFIPFLH
jgi:hypothetical protein